MKTISIDIAPARASVAAWARTAVACTGSFAGAVAPSAHVPSSTGNGSPKQERKHLAMTRYGIDGWPPGPQPRSSG